MLQFGFPHDFRAIAVGDDEARLQGHQVGGRSLRDGEIEPVRDEVTLASCLQTVSRALRSVI
jgi:hypothetical protein